MERCGTPKSPVESNVSIEGGDNLTYNGSRVLESDNYIPESIASPKGSFVIRLRIILQGVLPSGETPFFLEDRGWLRQ